MLIADQIKKQYWYSILALIAAVSVPSSFMLGVLYLLIPNALATAWGQSAQKKKRVIKRVDFINMYAIKIAILVSQSVVMMPLVSNWPMFISGMLFTLLGFSLIPFIAREYL